MTDIAKCCRWKNNNGNSEIGNGSKSGAWTRYNRTSKIRLIVKWI